jgi:CRP-like cAMP-binding protein
MTELIDIGGGVAAQHLTGIAVLAGLTEEELVVVAEECVAHTAGAGQTIIAMDDVGHDVYFLLWGTARVAHHTLLGRSVTLSDLPAGSYFGELSAIDGGPRSALVEAATDCQLARVSPDGFRRLLVNHPSLLIAVLQNLTGMIRHTNATVLGHATL